MALFESTNKSIERLPNATSEKWLNKVLGTDFMLKKLRSMTGPEIGNFRAGAVLLAFIFAGTGYHFYRQHKKQTYMKSFYYYRLINSQPLNAGKQFWFNHEGIETNEMTYYYRMPRKEFDIKYRMRSAYITGQFDHNKEILIPTQRYDRDGYDIYTPFYYYDKLLMGHYLQLHSNGTPFDGFDSKKAAMPVFRGW